MVVAAEIEGLEALMLREESLLQGRVGQKGGLMRAGGDIVTVCGAVSLGHPLQLYTHPINISRVISETNGVIPVIPGVYSPSG